jgi:hypothetical protein
VEDVVKYLSIGMYLVTSDCNFSKQIQCTSLTPSNDLYYSQPEESEQSDFIYVL